MSEQGTVVVTETTESHDDSLPLSEDHDLDTKATLSSSTHNTNSEDISTKQIEQNSSKMKDSNLQKPVIPRKPDLKPSVSGDKMNVLNSVKQPPPNTGELTVSELVSESESDQSRVDSDKVQMNGKQKNKSNSGNSDNSRKKEKTKERRSSNSGTNKKEMSRDSNQNITYMKHEEKSSKESDSNIGLNKDTVLETNENGILIDNPELNVENGNTKSRKNKRKQVRH